jgi:hypothetical protein
MVSSRGHGKGGVVEREAGTMVRMAKS